MTDPHALLFASLVALLVGPVLYLAFARRPWGRALLQVGLLLAVGALVVGHVLPECIALAGGAAALAGLVGFALPVALERGHRHEVRAHHALPTLSLVLAFVALALHAATDGASLGLGGHAHAGAHAGHGGHAHAELGYAVVLHRLPVGAALFALFARGHRRWALWAIGTIAAMTVVGFAFAETSGAMLSAKAVAIFQAFAAGVLLHVFVHPHDTTPAPLPSATPGSETP